jgi:hypothetical protein
VTRQTNDNLLRRTFFLAAASTVGQKQPMQHVRFDGSYFRKQTSRRLLHDRVSDVGRARGIKFVARMAKILIRGSRLFDRENDLR